MNMPTCLALDASTDRLSIAVERAGHRLLWETAPARTESERLFVHIERLLTELQTDTAGLAVVAFGRGPGSFTGLRITAAAAQALAFALGIPVTSSSSLAIQAATAMRETGANRVAVANDARVGRVFWGLYARTGDGMSAEMADCVIDPETFRYDGPPAILAVGSAWRAYPRLSEVTRVALAEVRHDLLPSAIDLLDLCRLDFQRGEFIAPEEAQPNYLGHGPVAASATAAGTLGRGPPSIRTELK